MVRKEKIVCINRELNAGPIDGNDRGYHYPTDANTVAIGINILNYIGAVSSFSQTASKTPLNDNDAYQRTFGA